MTSNSENDSSVYNKLVKTLNKIPEGFSLTEDGTHIRVLKWLFTEEEADIVRRMKLWAETVEELSERLDLPLPGLVEKLEAMINKGLIILNILHGILSFLPKSFIKYARCLIYLKFQ